jgi:hypothetical protein
VHILRCLKYAVPVVAVFALVTASAASAFVISNASVHVVQTQPPAGSCHVRGQYPFNMPEPQLHSGRIEPGRYSGDDPQHDLPCRVLQQHSPVDESDGA